MIYKLGDRQLEAGDNVWIADNATVIGSVILGNNLSIWFNCVLRADNDVIRIDDDSNIQDGSILHNDFNIPLTIGKHVTVDHKVILHGCKIGDHSLLNINAVVLNHAKLGNN